MPAPGVQYKNVAPVGDRVFVKIDKEEDKTTGGILLPTSAQKKPTQGQVVTAGDSKAVKVCYPWIVLCHCTFDVHLRL